MAVKPVCLICLEKFNQGKSDGGSNNLNEKFLNLLQQHLQIPPSSLSLLKPSKTSSFSFTSLHLFCDDCKVVISGICKLYQELLLIQNRLGDKLGKLEEIIEDSFEGPGGDKRENLLVSSITKQLKGYQEKIGNRQVFEMRILLSHYCKPSYLKDFAIN